MLLLTGPPASGKTRFCVSELRERLSRGESNCHLLVPTTTMAEHLRNELTREGFVFSPRVVSTFGKFLGVFFPSVSTTHWLWHIAHVPPVLIGPMVLGNMDIGVNALTVFGTDLPTQLATTVIARWRC